MTFPHAHSVFLSHNENIINLASQTLYAETRLNNARVPLNLDLNTQSLCINGLMQTIDPEQLDLIALHHAKLKLAAVMKRLDPSVAEAFAASCRRDGSFYSVPLGLEVNPAYGDRLEIMGFEQNHELAIPMWGCMYNTKGDVIAAGGLTIATATNQQLGTKDFLMQLAWHKDEISTKNGPMEVWRPPLEMCKSCEHVLSCRGMNL